MDSNNKKDTTSQQQQYFSEIKKGEVSELRTLLKNASNERDLEKLRSALQRVIYYMTMGIDVSQLFPDIIMVVNTTDVIVKKMVYLYICNYANDNLLLLVINTLNRDCQDSNPMIRGLALRSLCSLNSMTTFEYSFKSVTKSLGDPSAYVRKTAVLGLAKLYHLLEQPQQQQQQQHDYDRETMFEELLPKIYGMIMDQDGQVIVNTILTLDEIRPNWDVSLNVVQHLLAKFKELNEWGQIIIINTLHRFQGLNEDLVFNFMNLFDERLKSTNSALVLSIVGLFLKITEQVPSLQDVHEQIYTRLKNPLLTLMENVDSNEITYTILCHIHLIQIRSPLLYKDDYKYFYCKFREPIYIKILKMKILQELVNVENSQAILNELNHYLYENDMVFVKQVVESISFLSYKKENPNHQAIKNIVLDIYKTVLELESQVELVGYVLVALKDFLRVSPTDANQILPLVSKKLITILELDSQSQEAILWMMGEFPFIEPESPYIIETFFEYYQQQQQKQIQEQEQQQQQPPSTQSLQDQKPKSNTLSQGVKIQLLITITRMFLANNNNNNEDKKQYRNRAGEVYPILMNIYGMCSEINMNQDPGLYNQFLFYYRLLLLNIEKASKIINHKSEQDTFVEDELLENRDKIFDEFNTLSILYGKHSSTFIKDFKKVDQQQLILQNNMINSQSNNNNKSNTTATTTSPKQQPHSNQLLLTSSSSGNQLIDVSHEIETSPHNLIDTFTLERSPELQPQQFQDMWMKFEEGHVMDIQLMTMPDVEQIENTLLPHGIICMAFGSVDGQTKLYYHSKQIEDGPWFLVEIIIDESSLKMTLAFKSGDIRLLHSKYVTKFLAILSKCIPNIFN